MATDDSMSDDVFEDDTLRAPAQSAQRSTPSPTGYRDYHPPAVTPSRTQDDDDVIIHKTVDNRTDYVINKLALTI
ncbi:hypothetical protein SFRURICE_008940 [Spodoptera frugiperda]|nr:hypothetical protein SFRURICE_008940 [Spodoptera frugiperda]